MDNNFSEKFVETILANNSKAKLVSGGREILLRCPICGDSRDIKSAHMYIKVPKDNQIPLYNCFKCNESGVVTPKFLRMLDIYNMDVLSNLVDYNNKISKSLNFRNIDDENKVFDLNNYFISPNELSEIKLRYINKRLGTNLDYAELLRIKVILNLNDLLCSNNITTYTRDPNIVTQLNDSFIGFISADNAFVNMRNLTPGKVYKSIDKRYINYNIFGKMSNSQRYYIIPNSIDISNPNPIKVHIAEGAFDILSIYYNLNNGNKEHSIYAAIGGKSYLNIIKYFIEMKGLINIELHIYPDLDIDNYTMYKISEYLKPFNISVFIHRNIFEGEKDFGVPPSRIKENVEMINKAIIY